MMNRLGTFFLSPLLILCLGGCAVFLPYVHPKAGSESDASLAKAIAYANSVKSDYLTAQNAYAGTATVLPLVAIPLAASGLGLAMVGTTGAAITALGLAAGTSVAGGVWLQNKPREMAYNLGYQAINCLLQSVEPFQAAAADDFHRAVFGDRKTTPPSLSLAELRVRLEAQIEKLRIAASTQAEPAKSIYLDYVQDARLYLKDTGDIEAAGEQLAGTASGVARNLVNNVDAVVGKINNAIRETTPNVQAVAATIAGLNVLQPTAMPKTGAAAPPTVQIQRQGVPASPIVTIPEFDQVQVTIQSVASLTTVIRTAITKSQYTKDTPTIASCLQIPDSFSLVVRAAESSISIKQNSTRRVALSGGKGPYSATVASGPPKAADLAAVAKMDGGFFVEVAASQTCPPVGTDKAYKIHVSDATGTGTDIAVAVEAAANLTASKTEIVIDSNTDQAIPIVLSGGKPPYSAVVSGSTNVTATADPNKADTFTIAAKKNATPGNVVFVDSSPSPLSVAVQIKGK
jgi:hypothetical protein